MHKLPGKNPYENPAVSLTSARLGAEGNETAGDPSAEEHLAETEDLHPSVLAEHQDEEKGVAAAT